MKRDVLETVRRMELLRLYLDTYIQLLVRNYCGCILTHTAISSLHEKLYRHKSVENKTFAPWKKNAWRMLIPFVSHTLWFYFLPPLLFGSSASWRDTWFEWQLLLSVSCLYIKVQVKTHETISTCVTCGQGAEDKLAGSPGENGGG
jgi:hypothetical protein